jgi:hypothetical protein
MQRKRLVYLFLLLLGILITIPLFILPSLYIWRPAGQITAAEVIAPGTAPSLPNVPSPPTECDPPTDPDEPPCHPGLARSAWPITHQGSYAQGSSARPGPRPDQSFLAQHLDLASVAISYNFTAPYADGGVAVWASLLTLDGVVVKLDHDAFTVIDSYNPQLEETDPPDLPFSITGAYSLVDHENRFLVGRGRALEAYADSVPGDRYSAIALVQRFTFPTDFFCDEEDTLVGLNLTYDGALIVVTEKGIIGALPRRPEAWRADNLQSLALHGADCAAEDAPVISNSIAVDETGGIFIVTSREMVRVQWDGDTLALAWRAAYPAGAGALSALRLGPGSGSTPSLMGTGNDADRFVIFTDGQELMHLIFMWRDEIPEDWLPIATGLDRRLACAVPIRFGDAAATRSLSEQSVLVRGYAAVVVNNLLPEEPGYLKRLPPFFSTTLSAVAGGNPEKAPYGLERVDWDPETRTCNPVWANSTVSIPNGIPTMSADTGLIYGIGQREGVWGLEMVTFEDGQPAGFVPARQTTCSMQTLEQVNRIGLRFALLPILLANPRTCENSVFAAAQIGPAGTIYSGTMLGVTKFSAID